MRALHAKQCELNAFISDYWRKHPKAPVREACLAYLRQKGLLDALPPPIRARLEDEEARNERQAIQQESASR